MSNLGCFPQERPTVTAKWSYKTSLPHASPGWSNVHKQDQQAGVSAVRWQKWCTEKKTVSPVTVTGQTHGCIYTTVRALLVTTTLPCLSRNMHTHHLHSLRCVVVFLGRGGREWGGVGLVTWRKSWYIWLIARFPPWYVYAGLNW